MNILNYHQSTLLFKCRFMENIDILDEIFHVRDMQWLDPHKTSVVPSRNCTHIHPPAPTLATSSHPSRTLCTTTPRHHTSTHYHCTNIQRSLHPQATHSTSSVNLYYTMKSCTIIRTTLNPISMHPIATLIASLTHPQQPVIQPSLHLESTLAPSLLTVWAVLAEI